MIKLHLPDVSIEVHPDGDWLIQAKTTGFIQIPAAVIEGLTNPRHPTWFKPKPGGWPLTMQTPDGPKTIVYATREAYREAKRCL